MNWKHEAEEKLRSYDAMQAASDTIPKEIRRLQQAAYGLRSTMFCGVPSGGNLRAKEDQLLDCMGQQQELQWQLGMVRQWLEVTDAAMDQLKREDQQLLRRLYGCKRKGSVEALCQELGVERSSVYRRRDQALSRFATALYGQLPS